MGSDEEPMVGRDEGDRLGTSTTGRRTSRSKDGLVIAALAAGATHLQAGRVAGVSERTVRRRLESEAFRERLREAEEALVGQVSKQLTGLAPTAVETLARLMADPEVTDQVKLRASLGVLNASRVWREATEVEDRLRELENQVVDFYSETSA